MTHTVDDNHQMLRAIQNARILREQISAAAGDDPDFIRDGIEGETNLLEMIDVLVAADGEDETLIDASSAYIEKLKGRLDAIKKRKETRRALIGLAMELAELKSRRTPSGTVSLRPVAPKAIVQEEAEIPSKFWRAQPPKLDKTALTEALRARANAFDDAAALTDATARAAALAKADEEHPEIPGATLTNGGVTSSIKRS